MNNYLESQLYNIVFTLCAYNIILFVTHLISGENYTQLKISIITNTILQYYIFIDNIYKLIKFPWADQKLFINYISYISYCILFLTYSNIIITIYVSYKIAFILEILYILIIIFITIPFLNIIGKSRIQNNLITL